MPLGLIEGHPVEHITLSDKQLDVVAQAHDPVAVHDEQGKLRGYITMVIGSDELADARRALASQEARYTTTQVLAELRARGAS
ncbi:MAG: hypothetical protein WD063_17915 [Pirellulales bacterium]